jgi:ribosomal-protein-alanine N-acetyltransferase
MIGELRTLRLKLEPLTAAHAPLLYSGFADPRLYEFIPQEPPASEESLAKRYRSLERRQSPDGSERWWNWAILERDAGAYVGLIEVTFRGDGVARVAYFVFSKFARQGYAREALGAVLTFLFDDARAEKISASVDTLNARSIRLLESLGFVREAFVPNADVVKGRNSDEFVYGLSPDRGD